MGSTKHNLPQMSDWLSKASLNSCMMSFTGSTSLIEMWRAGSNSTSSLPNKISH